jgi:hypothetical protein
VVIETDLADRNHAGRVEELLDPALPRAVTAAGLVRVEADRGKDTALVETRELDHGVEILPPGGGDENSAHAGLRGAVENRVPLIGGEHRKMGVRIDHRPLARVV